VKDYFALPTNIKQIGSISDGMRIYMEDYVCTYLSQYAQAGGYDERLALLVGRYLLIDGQPVLFINGAIQGKHVEERDGLLHFSERTNAYVDSMIAEFFEGHEVVGWMQSQPGYGTFLNQQYAAYHFKEFPKISQVMFVIDPLENVNAFYTYNDDRSSLTETRGYFIYYERNTNMHEYMLTNKATETDYNPQPAAYVNPPKMEETAEEDFEVSPESIIRKRTEQRTVKRSVRENKRTLNLLVSMSAVLFVVCFVLGAGLVQSQNRIGDMETQVMHLNAAYRNLYAQLANPVFAQAVHVAAAQTPQTEAPALAPADDEEVTETVAPQEAEGLRTIDGIPVGPPLNVPSPAPPPVAPTAARYVPESYVIQPGDSLSAISLYFYGVDRVAEILALNGMDDADMIIAGRSILLP